MKTQVYEIYIKTTAQKVWDAITKSEWTTQYGYQGPVEYDLKAGGQFKAKATPPLLAMGMPEVVVDGEVLEASPPNKLVQTYRFLFNDQFKAEGFTKLTWEIEETASGFTRLTVIHDMENAAGMAAMVSNKFSEMGGGGWSWILSDLKSVLETGASMSAACH
ncbi:SRPBCC domain-containing protein [soil metagenome]